MGVSEFFRALWAWLVGVYRVVAFAVHTIDAVTAGWRLLSA